MQLVIDSFGTSIHSKLGSFEIVNKDGKKRLAPAKLKSIVLNYGTKISSDAVALAVEHQIDILFVGRTGKPHARVWSPKFGSVSTIRKNQVDFARSVEAIDWIKDNLVKKIEAQGALLHSLVRDRPAKKQMLQNAAENMQAYAIKIAHHTAQTMQENAGSFRGWEGNASRHYFGALGKIVPDKYKFEKRTKRPAEDMFNCALNYVYGMLYGAVESALVRAGVDPYLGILHSDDYNRAVLTYDFIEPYRVWAEAIVLQLCFRRLLEPEMFDIKDNAYWLASSGRQMVIGSANDYLNEVVLMNKKKRSRLTHILDDARIFASMLLNYKPNE
ncbi:MAG: CRISPR-associated endonuclease Cas1 [Thalassobius sp.]|nr:CRISPR-associated endonuclease Cas1 [Thalassovita sp.]